MNILGISCFYHDAAACILKDGEILAAVEEERFTRKKHDYNFPINAINFCLKYAKIKSQDLDYVVFYEKPFIKFERILMSIFQTFPKSYKVFPDAMKTWLFDKLWIKSTIQERLKISSQKILFSEHHLSHAASSFFCSPFKEAAIITADGVGEWITTTIGVGKDNQIKILKEIHFPHSLGLLYSTFTAFLGFEVNEGEYKVMSIAPYGKPRYVDKIYKLIKFYSDGSFELNIDYFSFYYSIDKPFNSKFISLFGEPRNPKVDFLMDSKNIKYSQYYADIAASIQKVLEDAVINMAISAYKEIGLKRLCLAGGVALNSVANWKIIKNTPFEEIYIPSSPGDGGCAIGSALYLYHFLNKSRRFILEHPFLGKGYCNDEIKNFLINNGIKYEYIEDEDKLLNFVVVSLLEGKVIGWFQGRFEFGPRALGNRSILADPRRRDMKDIINDKVKFRESFRPFAPSVLFEKAEEYFDIKGINKHYPARFMLYVVDVKNEKKDFIPAVTHIDDTARIQVVYKENNPRFYKLIEKFGDACSIPIVLNTSFNLKGEPIVNTPEDAYKTFLKSGLELLILENYIIKKIKN